MEYEVAKIEDYGYKDHTKAAKAWKIIQSIIVVLCVIAMYLSIFFIFLQSINNTKDTSTWSGFTLKWYGQIIKSRALWDSITNTFVISIAATLISTVIGTFIAVGIHSLGKKSQKISLLLNNIPLLNADIVTGISLMLIFSFFVPIFKSFFGWKTLLLAHIYFTLPYTILSVLPKLRVIDQSLFDASIDLGVKPYKTYIKVIIPAINAGILSGAILAFTMSFDDFVISYYTSGNGFDTLSTWIYSSVGRKELTPAVYAFSSLFTICSALAIVLFNFVVKGNSKFRRKKYAKKK